MTDKELIKQEIESYKDSMKGLEPHSDFRRGKITAYNQIMQFIDSLPEEPVSEELEEEFYRFIDEEEGIPKMCNTREYIAWGVDIAHHFAEWQKKQMMKDTVDATIFSELKGSDGSLFQAKTDRFRMNGVKISDKIKVIPIKN